MGQDPADDENAQFATRRRTWRYHVRLQRWRIIAALTVLAVAVLIVLIF